MKNSRLCRDYQGGDEHEILTLYKEVNNREMALEYWRWRFAEIREDSGISHVPSFHYQGCWEGWTTGTISW